MAPHACLDYGSDSAWLYGGGPWKSSVQVIEKTGLAQVLLPDNRSATGSYHLVIEPTASFAKGVVRLDQGQQAHATLGARCVRIRFDQRVELQVSVHLYVPAAGLIAFTCTEASAIVRV